ncbi:MAG: DNA translocase FtsK [Lachnospiraceae bacterium]|jgi:S-DNA-T family DNA segregation ATPase FtsK/SpoIIIE|nr:DNA translocase FtsK [Lachnospiraceae bacterium]
MAAGTTKKRQTTSRKHTTGKKTAAKKHQQDTMIRKEILILGLFAVSVLLLISNFGVGGFVGGFVSGVMFGIFGLFAYVLPVVLFLVTAFSISNRENTIAAIKAAAMGFAGVLCCCFMQLLTGAKEGEATAKAFYLYSSQEKRGGGFLGGEICKLLTGAFGVPGTWILLSVLMIICLVVITERSFISGVKRGGRKVYDSAREDAARRKKRQEEREARRREEEEKQVSRVEKKVTGVALDTTIGEQNLQEEWEEEELQEQAQEAVEENPVEEEEAVPEPVEEPKPLPRIHMGNVREITVDEPNLQDLEELFDVPLHRARTAEELREEEQKDGAKSAFVGQRDREYAEEGSSEAEQEKKLQGVLETGQSGQLYAGRETDLAMSWQGAEEIEPDKEACDAFGTVEEAEDMTEPKLPEPGSQRTGGQAGFTHVRGEASGTGVSASRAEFQEHLSSVRRENQEDLPPMKAVAPVMPAPKPYVFPSLQLLKQMKPQVGSSRQELQETALHLQQILRNFGVGVTVTDVSCGPSVTRYELQPDQGVKVSRIVALSDDIKLNLAVSDIRIEAPIPGKAAVGIEVPNAENAAVSFRELVSSPEFQNHKSQIAFAVGKDIAGKIVVSDIAKMPHLLIAGATGSGKSVCINTLIMSILYKADPSDVKLIMVDPKVVELSVYNGIPHLLIPVVTDPKKAAGALNWAVAEMMDRYKKFADCNVRNLVGYNEKIAGIADIDDPEKPKKLPQIVIIVDELADLMMVASNEVEDAICRLAQLARAAGIHLIIATQRPSVNVITGLIKANMPSRVAFAVSSGVDSRTIIDMNGAEKLLGKGDMLFYPSGLPKPMRVQGAFVSDEEVGSVVEFLSQNNGQASYSDAVEEHISNSQMGAGEPAAAVNGSDDGRDVLFVEAGRFILEKEKASIGMLQRWFKVGFNRAARIMDQLAEAGVVGDDAGTKAREILMTREEFEQYLEESR